MKSSLQFIDERKRISRDHVYLSASFSKPHTVHLDASTVCQLKCPTCPNATGNVKRGIGSGFLRFDDFKKFIDSHPWVSHIELSNWGEIFLNPELHDIIQYGYERNIALSAKNGANFNDVSEDVLEALVKYKFRFLTCSLDGASQTVYSVYRVNGNFDSVINNIEKLNGYKKKHRSSYPFLTWQFIPFRHNEGDIGKARKMSKQLNMNFKLKLSWDDLYTDSFSPIINKSLIRKESGLGVANREEYENKYGTSYISQTCCHLWINPCINHDGRLLGCTVNHWGDFGNVFERGLEDCLNSEAVKYAKQMLLGTKQAREGIPCSECKIYEQMKERNSWVRLTPLHTKIIGRQTLRMLTNVINNRLPPSLVRALARQLNLIKRIRNVL